LWGELRSLPLGRGDRCGPDQRHERPTNAKIPWIKRLACGYRNRERFRNTIYFHLRGLDLYPGRADPHEILKRPEVLTPKRYGGGCPRYSDDPALLVHYEVRLQNPRVLRPQIPGVPPSQWATASRSCSESRRPPTQVGPILQAVQHLGHALARLRPAPLLANFLPVRHCSRKNSDREFACVPQAIECPPLPTQYP